MTTFMDRAKADRAKKDAIEYERRYQAALRGEYGPKVQAAVRAAEAKKKGKKK